eukprot:6211424-Pleurochrysis_carterae.AAC.5
MRRTVNKRQHGHTPDLLCGCQSGYRAQPTAQPTRGPVALRAAARRLLAPATTISTATSMLLLARQHTSIRDSIVRWRLNNPALPPFPITGYPITAHGRAAWRESCALHAVPAC